VQADPASRLKVEDIGALEVRNADGKRVPLRTLIKIRNTAGPAVVNHYNPLPVRRDQTASGRPRRQFRPGAGYRG